MKKADIGLIGLGVMGENLILNMEKNGYTVACFNRTTSKITSFLETRAKNKNIIGCYSLTELASCLKKPRKVLLMVKAGDAVDQTINNLLSVLDKGDIIIDGGNSNFLDTIRRYNALAEEGIMFLGMGVSGGEEGALNGPSLMPGGSKEAYNHLEEMLNKISAKTADGHCCSCYIGDNGAGHFVKMVHNGIEYGDMQLICESFDLMRKLLKLSNKEMADVYADWNKGELDSYLIEITKNILAYKENNSYLVDYILDTAGQKGTGKWTSIESLNESVPLTLISEAVYARFLSSLKDERVEASKHFQKEDIVFNGDKKEFIEDIRKALYASKIISYAQGYALMMQAAKTYGWNLDFGNIALIWRGGCIIRSRFLGKIKEAFVNNPSLNNLMLDPYFRSVLLDASASFRKVVAMGVLNGIALPAMSSALAYFDGYTSAILPANLLQAQRDYFGAHTYERIDCPRGEFYHTNWMGEKE